MKSISIQDLESAINECRRAEPPVDNVIGNDLRQLATVWGEMIYMRKRELDLNVLSLDSQIIILRWLNAVDPTRGALEREIRKATSFDLRSDSCDACQ